MGGKVKHKNEAINSNDISQSQQDQKDEAFERELATLMNDGQPEKKKKRSGKKWSRKRKIVLFAAVGVVILFLLSRMFGGGKAVAPFVMVSPLQKGDIMKKLSVSGPISGTDSAEVVSNLHTEILEISIKEGDKVTKDQVLAILDSSEIRKSVDIAQNAYNLAITTLKEKNVEAEIGYAKALQDYQANKADFDRKNVLFQAGSVSQVELDTARNLMNDSQRQLRTFNIKNGRAVANDSYELDVKSKAFELEQKQKDLHNTQVKSPIDGTVVRVNCKVGRFADKTDDDKPMFIIDNLDNLEMKINVSEYSIGDVQVGQPVTISADILGGDTVKGEVTAISPTGEGKGNASDSERVIPTTIRILDQNTRLIAGITAKAEILLAESKDTWVLPISALIQMPDGSYAIAVAENQMIRMIPVETGVESDVEIEVIAVQEGDLMEGMQVVTAPFAGITDGMAVTPIPAA